MNKDYFLALMGLWLVVLAFLGFPFSIVKMLVIISGLVISIISFRSLAKRGINKKVEEMIANPESQSENQPNENS